MNYIRLEIPITKQLLEKIMIDFISKNKRLTYEIFTREKVGENTVDEMHDEYKDTLLRDIHK